MTASEAREFKRKAEQKEKAQASIDGLKGEAISRAVEMDITEDLFNTEEPTSKSALKNEKNYH
jgi:hypothetical protein